MKKMILTSKRHAKHPFAGQNTQHSCITIVLNQQAGQLRSQTCLIHFYEMLHYIWLVSFNFVVCCTILETKAMQNNLLISQS